MTFKKLGLAALLVGGTCSVALAQNTSAQISNNSFSASIGTSSTTSVTSSLPTISSSSSLPNGNFWRNTGPASQDAVFAMGWYYRISGDTRERILHNASSKTATANSVTYDWGTIQGAGGTTITGLSARTNWTIWGDGANPNNGWLFSDLDFFNNTANSVTVDLFFIVDADIVTASNDAYGPLEISGNRRTWNATGGPDAGGPYSVRVSGFDADGSGAGSFSTISGQFTDSNVDNFIPDVGVAGTATPGDYAYTHQWRRTITAGSSFRARGVIAQGTSGAPVTPVPEPASMTALGLGILALARKRRKK